MLRPRQRVKQFKFMAIAVAAVGIALIPILFEPMINSEKYSKDSYFETCCSLLNLMNVLVFRERAEKEQVEHKSRGNSAGE